MHLTFLICFCQQCALQGAGNMHGYHVLIPFLWRVKQTQQTKLTLYSKTRFYAVSYKNILVSKWTTLKFIPHILNKIKLIERSDSENP